MRHALLLLVALTLALAAPTRAAPDHAAEAAALTSRVAAGSLAQDRLEVAALLGHEPAKLALGRPPTKAALVRCGHEASVRLALAALQATAKRWGGPEPLGAPIVQALAAMQAWVGCPCPDHAATCKKLEEEVSIYTEKLLDLDPDAPDLEALFDAAQRRAQVGYAAELALLTVRAPQEKGEGTPAPAPEIALDVVGDAGEAESLARGAEAPEPTEAAARLLEEALAGTGHGRPSAEAQAAGKADLERWSAEIAAFEKECSERALVDVRAAFLPWLLAGGK